MDDVLLGLDNVTKRFPGVTALHDVSMQVQTGEVHALVGENGAGKSTLLKIIFGALQPDTGSMTLRGQTLSPTGPAEAMRLGISFIPQDVVVFNPISVAENLAAGREPRGRLPFAINWREAHRDAERLLERVGLKVSPRMQAGRLSAAQKQLLLIARALAMDCCLLLMDEPSSSLTPREIDHLFGVIEDLKQRDISIVYVSHKLSEVFRIADRVTVLRDGVRISTAGITEITMPEVVNHMVGRDLSTEYPEKRVKANLKPMLEVKRATGTGFHDVSLTVSAGEIVGLFGLIGSGRTEFARAVFGRDPLVAGEIWLDGQKVEVASTHAALRMGLGLVPEGRKEQGVFDVRSVRENTSACVLDRLGNSGLVSRRRELDLTLRTIDELDVQTPSPEQLMRNLSGGNQQKVILGRWLATESRLLILDEPTAGIDVGTKAEIHRLVADLAKRGKAILYISSELPEVLGISDRIVVFHEGRMVGEFDGQTATEQTIMTAIMEQEMDDATNAVTVAQHSRKAL
jgi:ABC-type sugar transport system ATPase subunit